jgi:hypothetical protein
MIVEHDYQQCSATTLLPANASFRFSCTSSQGAILMLETPMSRTTIQQDDHYNSYARQHCLSWYKLAFDNGIEMAFGDLMLVTEFSKTAAWASAVYSENSRNFKLQFSVGGDFQPVQIGVGASVDYETIGCVQHRRSRQSARSLANVEGAVYDQTVFIKGYRPGPRSLYPRSIAQRAFTGIKKLVGRPPKGDQAQDAGNSFSGTSISNPGRSVSSPQSGSDGGAKDSEGQEPSTPHSEFPVSIEFIRYSA